MKKTITSVALCTLLYSCNVFGAYNCYTSTGSLPTGYASTYLGQRGSNCSSRSRLYFCSQNDRYCDFFDQCASCPTGYTLCEQEGAGSGCANVIYKSCCVSGGGSGSGGDGGEEASCNSENCKDDEYFVPDSNATGYRKKAIRMCDKSADVCRVIANTYICDIGYYGIDMNSPKTTPSGCVRCPCNGITMQSSTSITSCFLWSGATCSDETGTYTITGGNCYYSE